MSHSHSGEGLPYKDSVTSSEKDDVCDKTSRKDVAKTTPFLAQFPRIGLVPTFFWPSVSRRFPRTGFPERHCGLVRTLAQNKLVPWAIHIRLVAKAPLLKPSGKCLTVGRFVL